MKSKNRTAPSIKRPRLPGHSGTEVWRLPTHRVSLLIALIFIFSPQSLLAENGQAELSPIQIAIDEQQLPLDGEEFWIGAMAVDERVSRTIKLRNHTGENVTIRLAEKAGESLGLLSEDLIISLQPGQEHDHRLEVRLAPFKALGDDLELLISQELDGEAVLLQTLTFDAISKELMAETIDEIYAQYMSYTLGSEVDFEIAVLGMEHFTVEALWDSAVGEVLSPRAGYYLSPSMNIIPKGGGQIAILEPLLRHVPESKVDSSDFERSVGDTLTAVAAREQSNYSRYSRVTALEVSFRHGQTVRHYRAVVLWGGLTGMRFLDHIAGGLLNPLDEDLAPPARDPDALKSFNRAKEELDWAPDFWEGFETSIVDKNDDSGRECLPLPAEHQSFSDVEDWQGLEDHWNLPDHRHYAYMTGTIFCECRGCQSICRGSITDFVCDDLAGPKFSLYHGIRQDDDGSYVDSRSTSNAKCTVAAACVVTQCFLPFCSEVTVKVEVTGFEAISFNLEIKPGVQFWKGELKVNHECQPCREKQAGQVTVTGTIPAGTTVTANLLTQNTSGTNDQSSSLSFTSSRTDKFSHNFVSGQLYQFDWAVAPEGSVSCSLTSGSHAGTVSGNLEWVLDCGENACNSGLNARSAKAQENCDSTAQASVNWTIVEANSLSGGPGPEAPDTTVDLEFDDGGQMKTESQPVEGSGTVSFSSLIPSGSEYSLFLDAPRLSFCHYGDGTSGTANGSPINGQIACTLLVLPDSDNCGQVPAACTPSPTCTHIPVFLRVVDVEFIVGNTGETIIIETVPFAIYALQEVCANGAPLTSSDEVLKAFSGASTPDSARKATENWGPAMGIRLDPFPNEPWTSDEIPLEGFAVNPSSPHITDIKVAIDGQLIIVPDLAFNQNDPRICQELPASLCVPNSAFSGTLDISGLSVGSHVLKVWARSANGMWGSDSREFFVDPKVAPNCDPVDFVEMTAPLAASGFNHGEVVTLTATASDNNDIDRIAFYADGNLIAADHSAPYELDWSAVGGTEKLKARAYSTCGSFEASVIPIEVIGGPVCDGVVDLAALHLPASRSSYVIGEAVTLEADAEDASGIEKVHFVADGNLIHSDPTFPYRTTWTVTGDTLLKARAYSVCDNTSFAVDGQEIIAEEPAACNGSVDSVDLVAPVQGAILNPGATVTLTAHAEDDSGIALVKFYADGELIGEDSSIPFSVQWTATEGAKALTAEAHSTCSSDQTASDSHPVVVDEDLPGDQEECDGAIELVDLEYPSDGDYFVESTLMTLIASASDPDGIDRVEFYAGTSLIGTASTPPYAVDWAAGTPGEQVLTAKAFSSCDGSTHKSDSHTIYVTPSNCDGQVDHLALTSPRDGQVFWQGNTIPLSADAMDGAGIDRVEFFVNSTLVGADTEAPYQVTWLAHESGSSVTARAYSTCPNDPHAWDSRSMTVEPPPDPWEIILSYQCHDLSCFFDASGSTNEDLIFKWNFGDGVTGAGSKVTHRYQTLGPHLVQLVVTDLANQGKVKYQTLSLLEGVEDELEVACLFPTTFAGSSLTANDLGAPRVFDSIAETAGIGSFSVETVLPAGSMITFSPSGCPARGGFQYQLRSSADPSITASSYLNLEVTPAIQVSCDGQQTCDFIDVGHSLSGYEIVSWDFGDGTTVSGGVTQSHTYGSDGSYTVVLTVRDGARQIHSGSITVNVEK